MNSQPAPPDPEPGSSREQTTQGVDAVAGAAASDAAPQTSDAAAGVDDAVAEADDRLRRALADLDNLRKRYQRELVRERAAERARVTSDWLPVVDNLERALQHADQDVSPLLDGMMAIRAQALAILAKLGFPPFEDVGQPFDPGRHAAVGTTTSEAPKGTIVATVLPGYGTDDDVLRPAAVVVSQGPDASATSRPESPAPAGGRD